jgi:hypothetical protein
VQRALRGSVDAAHAVDRDVLNEEVGFEECRLGLIGVVWLAGGDHRSFIDRGLKH